MLKRSWLIALLFPVCALGADKKYPVSAIPAALKEGADAVVRMDVTSIIIRGKDQVAEKLKYVVTIFNSNADHFARMPVSYDKLTKVSDIRAAVYDANGELIKKLKSSEMTDVSAYDGSTLFSDNRMKLINLEQSNYPYTVEYEYETDYKYLYSFFSNRVLPHEKVAVQYFYSEITYPTSIPIRYKVVNGTQQPEKRTNTDGTETVKWELKDVPAMKEDPLSPLWSEISPRLMAAPTVFSYEGYSGNMETWKSYGQWLFELSKGRDILPDATKQKVRDLTKGLSTTEEKARVLYEYMQSRTRYINISLGIGGLQPFDAATVEKMGYGDCKALSNYMVTMLKEAGVKSFYSVIWAGDAPEVDLSFPSHQANHAVVAVPNGADTIWLECTSQTNPFGYQGTFTGDRYAMLVTEEGGKMVRTNRYPAEANKLISLADVVIDAQGNGKAKLTSAYTGIQYENGGLSSAVNLSPEQQKKWIQKNIKIPTFDVAGFSMTNVKERNPKAIVKADLVLNRFASVNGKRIFLTPNLMNRHTYIPEKADNRKTDVVIGVGYVDYDTIRYEVPESAYPEFLPQDVKLTSRFGEYECGYKAEQGKLMYMRRMKMQKGRYPAESYKELIDFYRNVNKADNVKVVLLTKT
jgi:transglutaminase-like putative cysteine protease